APGNDKLPVGSRWYCRHQHALSRYFQLSTRLRCVVVTPAPQRPKAGKSAPPAWACFVIPAQAGIQWLWFGSGSIKSHSEEPTGGRGSPHSQARRMEMDPRFRGDDALAKAAARTRSRASASLDFDGCSGGFEILLELRRVVLR